MMAKTGETLHAVERKITKTVLGTLIAMASNSARFWMAIKDMRGNNKMNQLY